MQGELRCAALLLAAGAAPNEESGGPRDGLPSSGADGTSGTGGEDSMAEHPIRAAGRIARGVGVAFDYLSQRTGVGALSATAKNGVPRKRR